MNNTQNLKLQPAITTYFKRLKAFLECDKDVEVSLDYDASTISVLVHDSIKAAAWREILPENKEYHGAEFKIEVNCDSHDVNEKVFLTAMQDNPNFSRFHNTEAGFIYSYMKPNILQFQNDNLGSPEMNETWTAEDLAREVIKLPLLNYCTEQVN